MDQRTKIYFASDFHLGIDTSITSEERERLIIKWLDHISQDAAEIFLLGDIFDYWYEYKKVVPKGYTRFLSKLAELTELGIKVHFFTGNHDMWLGDYFQKELGLIVHKEPFLLTTEMNTYYLAHGDGLGPGDNIYKLTKWLFRSRICRFLFGLIHPDLGIRLMRYFSKRSRKSQIDEANLSQVVNKRQLSFCEEYLVKVKKVNGFLMGHGHYPADLVLSDGKSRYVNLGDWMEHFTYARLEGNHLELLQYPAPEIK